jgi:hypothetical protein
MANESCVVVSPSPNPQALAVLPHRDGKTYEHDRDGARLHKQHNRVLACMKDGAWRSLAAISTATGDPEASVSARLRDLRKERFGGHDVKRRCLGRGLFEYRLVLNRKDLFDV